MPILLKGHQKILLLVFVLIFLIIFDYFSSHISISWDEDNSKVLKKESQIDYSFQKVKVLCWVQTFLYNHDRKAIHVKATWAKRCDKLIFMSNHKNDSLGSIDLGIADGKQWLWNKTREAFKYVYENHKDEYDWVLKADDDTYLIMENLI